MAEAKRIVGNDDDDGNHHHQRHYIATNRADRTISQEKFTKKNENSDKYFLILKMQYQQPLTLTLAAKIVFHCLCV